SLRSVRSARSIAVWVSETRPRPRVSGIVSPTPRSPHDDWLLLSQGTLPVSERAVPLREATLYDGPTVALSALRVSPLEAVVPAIVVSSVPRRTSPAASRRERASWTAIYDCRCRALCCT